jgi:antitoxin (DNA-binding transcriptional repressor) of toxin-antitoxin stability system
MHTIDVSQLQSLFPHLLEVVGAGEEVIITRNAEPFAKISLVNGSKAQKKEGDLVYGSGKGLLVMREDFDDPIEGFEEYM